MGADDCGACSQGNHDGCTGEPPDHVPFCGCAEEGHRDPTEEGVEGETIVSVLCDGDGECPLDVEEGQTIASVIDFAANMLDGAYLTNVVVVKTRGGKYLVGEYSFEFTEVSAEEAEQVARIFSPEDV